jgi:hypothetical protein
MAKRRNNDWTSEQVEFPQEDLLIEPKAEIVFGGLSHQEEPETVRIMMTKNVILNYTGLATGKLYCFNRGGSIIDVDKKDAEIMLKREEQRSCCGSLSTPYFEIVR